MCRLGPIPDHIKKDLKILFVGFNPSLRSGEVGHHFANPNNRFWTILAQSGLTPCKYKPEEDKELLKLGYGFTNIVARPTRTADEITKEEYTEGRRILRKKVAFFLPQIVCFVGKGVYQEYSERRHISWGPQPDPIMQGVTEYVAPSSSGLVRMKLSDLVLHYSGLKQLLDQMNPEEA